MSDPVTRLNAALEGRYAIERELGEGGMATVYLADDLKHNRKVALKVLKPEFAAVVGAECFLAEIQVTANLQHPHILPLHDSGEADGFLFYVMPYVEGESLRDRLDREHQLPVDEAVKITTDLAEALDYAHRHKVIHRDIKPANILMHEGRPLIADFGIALAVGAAGGGRLTETGLSLGTPHYMSPEQATGDQAVGSATDTYALGSVLYEMLVGEPPYPGTTAQAVLGKIIAGEPVSAAEHRTSVPENVDAAFRCALEKLPADRFTSAQEFVRALADPGFRYGELAVAGIAGAAVGPWKQLTMTFAALFAVATLTAGWALLRPDPPKLTQRFSLARDEGQIPSEWLSVSPDGSTMVLRYPNEDGEMQLWLRRFDGDLAPTPIPGTEGESWDPIISPNGEEVAFVQDGRLMVAPLRGGLLRTLADSVACCMRWGPDGFIYYEDASRGISRVPVTSVGGVGEPVIQREESDGNLAYFQVLPDGEVAVFTVWAPTARIEAMRLDTRERKVVVTGGVWAYVTSTGHLVFGTEEGQILAAPFDSEAMELTGPAVPLIEGVYIRVGNRDPSFSLSESGTLAYWRGGPSTSFAPVWVERNGVAREINPGWRVAGAANRSSFALSPDGAHLAISILDSEDRYDLWVTQLDTGPLSRLTFEGLENFRATWSPDGEWLTFVSNREGNYDVWTKRADGSGTAELVLDREAQLWEGLYSQDGTWLVFREGANQAADVYAMRLGMDSVAVPLEVTEFQERSLSLSPDGRWLAYVSNRSGRDEVYVRPFPDAGASLQQVSADGGVEPVWAHSGRELFYRNGANELVAVQVTGDPTFMPGQQDVLFSMADYLTSNGHPMYDVSPDDQRFVMLRIEDEDVESDTEFILVTNWFEELKERVGN